MASPAMSREITDSSSSNGPTVRIRRDTLIWALGMVLQLGVVVYSYGRLTAHVEAQGEQLNRVEQRLNEITGHK